MIMVERDYLSPGYPHHNFFPGAGSSHETIPISTAAASPNSSHPDLASYGPNSPDPYRLPDQNEALLTPISSGSSPLLHQVQKLVPQYPYPPTTPYIQQPTPPGSSKMYHQSWGQQFDMNGQYTQTSSPLTTQAPVAHEFLEHNYVPDGRRTPGPPVPYLGNFGVSDGPQAQPMSQPYYYDVPPSHVEHHHQMMMRDNQPMPLSPTPLHNEPHPSQFPPQRRLSAGEPVAPGLSDGHPLINGSPRRRTQQIAGRVKKRPSKARDSRSRGAVAEDPAAQHKDCFGREVPPTLKSSCPDEERCIFESRWRHRHQKGHDMWENIQKDFTNKFKKCPGKEMLQMKFKRGRSKYIEWNSRDEELLREAWYRVEKSRYEIIFNTFKELGGSRNMVLSPSDIEVKVVNDLKLEKGLYMDSHGDAHIRRRRKSVGLPRRRPGARGADDTEVPMSDEMMSVSSHNTHEDDVINQVHSHRDYRMSDEAPTGQNDVAGINIWGSQAKVEPGVIAPRNDRQECDEMMRTSTAAQPMYGRRRPS